MHKITILLLLISGAASAQKSILYNKHRQLIVDTSFKVDEHTYQNLPKIEREVLPFIYRNININRIPPNGNPTGLAIVQLSFSGGKCNFEIVRVKKPAFEGAVYMAFKYLKRDYEILKRKRKEEYLLYVPIRFETIPTQYNDLLKKNKAITIQREPFFYEGGFADTTVGDEQPITIPKLLPEKKSG
jgi:hypothetical protein